MDGQRYNLLGNGTCPVCFQDGKLDTPNPSYAGEVVGCRSCYTSFRFLPGTADQLPTLERFRAANAEARRCTCGSFVGSGFDRCTPCIAIEHADQRVGRAA